MFVIIQICKEKQPLLNRNANKQKVKQRLKAIIKTKRVNKLVDIVEIFKKKFLY